MKHKKYKYDVFISHSLKDKDVFTNDFVLKLIAKGLKVYWSSTELQTGEDMKIKFKQEIESSRFFIAVVSENFAASNWCNYELDIFERKESGRRGKILPIWLNISPEKAGEICPSLNGIYGKLVNENTDYLIEYHYNLIKEQTSKRILPWYIWASLGVLGTFGGLQINLLNEIPSEFENKAIEIIENRRNILRQKMESHFSNKIFESNLLNFEFVNDFWNTFRLDKSHGHHDLKVFTEIEKITTHKKFNSINSNWKNNPLQLINIENDSILLNFQGDMNSSNWRIGYLNENPSTFHIENIRKDAEKYFVKIASDHNLRSMIIISKPHESIGGNCNLKYIIYYFKKYETYIIDKNEDGAYYILN